MARAPVASDIQKLIEKAAERGAERANAKLLLMFGVNIQDEIEVREFKDNLQFLSRVNRGAKIIKSTTIKTCVGALVTGGLAILVLGLKDTVLSWLGK